ncbi:MAG: hypothetical protein ACYCQJ_08630 [Nitrososphaerales archaeon]
MADSPLGFLLGIFTVVWLLVLFGTVLIFKVIVPFTYCSCSYDSVAKAGFTTILALVWLYIFVILRDVFVRRRILV